MAPEKGNALFVRLTPEQSAKLDAAASALPALKKDLIGGLLERYVDASTEDGLARLRALTGAAAAGPVTIKLTDDALAVGHAAFRPAPEPEVLDVAQAAALLAVEEATITELAERGELPGRRIGGAWRFSRRALLDWLGGA